MSIAAYRASAERSDPRVAEARALAHATSRLEAARDAGAQGPELVSALHDNRTLWTTLADDCAMPTNALNADTRAGILSLSLFVQRHSSEIAAGRATLAPLIRMNQIIMSALTGDAAGAAPETRA